MGGCLEIQKLMTSQTYYVYFQIYNKKKCISIISIIIIITQPVQSTTGHKLPQVLSFFFCFAPTCSGSNYTPLVYVVCLFPLQCCYLFNYVTCSSYLGIFHMLSQSYVQQCFFHFLLIGPQHSYDCFYQQQCFCTVGHNRHTSQHFQSTSLSLPKAAHQKLVCLQRS